LYFVRFKVVSNIAFMHCEHRFPSPRSQIMTFFGSKHSGLFILNKTELFVHSSLHNTIRLLVVRFLWFESWINDYVSSQWWWPTVKCIKANSMLFRFGKNFSLS
jgi:hypothetical protein